MKKSKLIFNQAHEEIRFIEHEKKKKLKSKTKKRPRNELHQASNQPHFFESKTKSIKDNKRKGK